MISKKNKRYAKTIQFPVIHTNILDIKPEIQRIYEYEWRNKYKIIKIIGTGTFGITYLSYDEKMDKMIAIKVIDIKNSEKNGFDVDHIINELEILNDLVREGVYDTSSTGCHPYIACYYSSFISTFNGKPSIFAISEYIKGMELYDWLYLENKIECPPDAKLLWSMMYQMMEALVYIHNRGYAHRDIKLENIIIEEETNILKLIDFGLACYKDKCISSGGTIEYIPPEIFSSYPPNSLEASQAHDIWSAGIVFYELANLKYPFENVDIVKNGNELSESNYQPCENTNLNIIKILNRIIDEMLDRDWETRPTACYILKLLNRVGQKAFKEDISIYTNIYC
jgi:serine/threonine protein kinase